MTKRYYECHITMTGERSVVGAAVGAVGWSFSAIDGDPVLGAGVKMYATRHYSYDMSQPEVIERMEFIAEALSHADGVTVIRRKVELVVYDDKS